MEGANRQPRRRQPPDDLEYAGYNMCGCVIECRGRDRRYNSRNQEHYGETGKGRNLAQQPPYRAVAEDERRRQEAYQKEGSGEHQ